MLPQQDQELVKLLVNKANLDYRSKSPFENDEQVTCSRRHINEFKQEYIIKEKRVSNFAIANVECMRKVT